MTKHLILLLFIGLAWGQTLEKQYSKAELLYDSDLIKEAKLQLNEIINTDGNEKIVNESLLLLGKILVNENKPRKAKKVFDRLTLRDKSYAGIVFLLLSSFTSDGIFTRYGYNVHPNPSQASFIGEAVVSVYQDELIKTKTYGFWLMKKVWSRNIGGVDYYDRKVIYLAEDELLSFYSELEKFIKGIAEENKKMGNSSIRKSIEFPSGLSFTWSSSKNKSKELNPSTDLTISKNGKNMGMTNSGELSMVIKRGVAKIKELKSLDD